MKGVSIDFQEKLNIILFYLVIGFIGFGSTGSGVYNNNSISYSFLYFFVVFVLFFYKSIFEYINSSIAIPICIMFFSFFITCVTTDLEDKTQNWMRFYAIFASVILGYFSYILMVKNIISFIGVSRILAGIGLGHFFTLLCMWYYLPNPMDYNWMTGLYFFSHIRHLADFLSICFLSAFFLMYQSKNITQKILWLITVIIILSTILWTGSRAAYFSLFISIIVFLFIYKKYWVNIAIVLCTTLVSMWLSTLFKVSNIALGFVSSFHRSVGHSYSVDQVASGRTSLYKEVFEFFSYHPIWGNGGDAVMQLNIYATGTFFLQAHNSILQILIEFGVVGLLCVLFVLYRVMMGFKYNKLTNHQIYSLIIVLNIMVAALLNGGAYYVVTISLMCFFIAAIYAERASSNKIVDA